MASIQTHDLLRKFILFLSREEQCLDICVCLEGSHTLCLLGKLFWMNMSFALSSMRSTFVWIGDFFVCYVDCSFFRCDCIFLVFDRQLDSPGLPYWESPWGGGEPFCEGPHRHAVLLPEICIPKEVQPHPLAPCPGLVLPNCRLRVSEIVSI